MKSRLYFIAAVYLCLNFMPLPALSDTVFLKNGKTLKVETSWQEGDQVYFIFGDMKASIPQSKVVRIEKNSRKPTKSGSSENQSNADRKGTHPQPAEKFSLNPIKQTAGTSTDPQQLPQSNEEPLVLRKDGLGDLKWGSRLDNIPGLEIKPTDSELIDVMEYVRPKDTLKLGDTALKSVVYAFWRDELYTISIWTEGQKNFNALRDAAFTQFGKGTRVDGSSKRYLWTNDTTDVMLKYNQDGQYGLLWMRCKELDRKLKLSKLNSHTSFLKRMKSIR